MQLGEVLLSGERDQLRHWFVLTGEGENGRRHTNIKTLPKGSTVKVAWNEDLKFNAAQCKKYTDNCKDAREQVRLQCGVERRLIRLCHR